MELESAISLIKAASLPTERQTWADLGCGEGTFTRALASLLGDGSKIYAVDKNAHALRSLQLRPEVGLIKVVRDFTDMPLPVPALDGVLMANSLHYIYNKPEFILGLKNHLGKSGSILLVEYNLEKGNQWVPYPIPLRDVGALFQNCGFTTIRKLGEQPSSLNDSVIYSVLIR